MIYYWWIVLAMLLYGTYAYLSVQANNHPDQLKWVGITLACQAAGFWPLLARYSNNILLDGIIYDSVVLFMFYGVMIACGTGKDFTPCQWAGTAMVLVGTGLVKFCGSSG